MQEKRTCNAEAFIDWEIEQSVAWLRWPEHNPRGKSSTLAIIDHPAIKQY